MEVEQFVGELVSKGAIASARVREAFLAVDRRFFVPEKFWGDAYVDRPLPIGEGQTISQPYTVALMLEDLAVERGMRVLDVGCGSGWTTALLDELVGEEGEVVGVERVESLVEFGRENLSSFGSGARILHAGAVLGLPAQAPFDRILVSAAADEVPQVLVDQLVDGGLLVVPVRDAILTVRREDSRYGIVRRRAGFRFVPLVE